MQTNVHSWLGAKGEGRAGIETLLQDNCQGSLQVLTGAYKVEVG